MIDTKPTKSAPATPETREHWESLLRGFLTEREDDAPRSSEGAVVKRISRTGKHRRA